MRKVKKKKKRKSNLRNSGAINHHSRWYSSVNVVQSDQFKKLHRSVPLKCRHNICPFSLPIFAVSEQVRGDLVPPANILRCLQSPAGTPTTALETWTLWIMYLFIYYYNSLDYREEV